MDHTRSYWFTMAKHGIHLGEPAWLNDSAHEQHQPICSFFGNSKGGFWPTKLRQDAVPQDDLSVLNLGKLKLRTLIQVHNSRILRLVLERLDARVIFLVPGLPGPGCWCAGTTRNGERTCWRRAQCWRCRCMWWKGKLVPMTLVWQWMRFEGPGSTAGAAPGNMVLLSPWGFACASRVLLFGMWTTYYDWASQDGSLLSFSHQSPQSLHKHPQSRRFLSPSDLQEAHTVTRTGVGSRFSPEVKRNERV